MPLIQQRNGEAERFPIGVDHQVQRQVVVIEMERRREAVRGIAPIRRAQDHAVPLDTVSRDQHIPEAQRGTFAGLSAKGDYALQRSRGMG
jgi:hypothetical protein